jgi:hypothetical protein
MNRRMVVVPTPTDFAIAGLLGVGVDCKRDRTVKSADEYWTKTSLPKVPESFVPRGAAFYVNGFRFRLKIILARLKQMHYLFSRCGFLPLFDF